MPIYSNEGGVKYELDTVFANEGGVKYELDTVFANDGGVKYEIHKSAIEATWISFGSAYATIISQSNGKNSTTCKYYANYTGMLYKDTVKCIFNMKTGQTLNVKSVIEKTGGYTSSANCYLYDSSGNEIAEWYHRDGDFYTATRDLENCYMTFSLIKESAAYTVTETITLTIK